MSNTPTDADAQGVTPEMVERALAAYLDTDGHPGEHNNDYRKRAMRAAISAALAGEWVSVKERMPSHEGTFLGYLKDGDQMILYSHPDHDYHIDWWTRHVTHWRPLPKGPAMDATREGEG